MLQTFRSTAVKALSAFVIVTTLAACSEVPPTQPSNLAPQAAQLSEGITSTLVCANSTNTTYNSAAAFDITPHPAYGTLGGTASWIGPFANSGLTNVPVGTYVFTTSFNASEGDAISGQILADNGATVTLGATTLATIGATTPADQAVVATFQTASGFTGVLDGQNTLTVALNSGVAPFDENPNPTGVSYCFTIYNCPAAPAIANAYLKSIHYASNKQGKIISAVAQHMGPGATFDGIGKCDPGYAAAVIAFIGL